MDRRARFFFGAAAICALITPVTDPQHKWVAITLAITYVVLAVASMLDAWSRQRERSTPRSRPSPTPPPDQPNRPAT